MFKNIEYAGFDGRPELRPRAEIGTALLQDEVSPEWHDAVAVQWRPETVGLGVSVILTTPVGVGSASGLLRDRDFDPGDEAWLRSRLRRVWLDALDDLLGRRKKVWDEYLREPVEV